MRKYRTKALRGSEKSCAPFGRSAFPSPSCLAFCEYIMKLKIRPFVPSDEKAVSGKEGYPFGKDNGVPNFK